MVASALRGREESCGARSPTRWTATAPPKTSGKSVSAFVDAALAPDERGKRIRTRLVLRCVPQRARPFRPRSPVHFLRIRCAKDDGRERLVVRQIQAGQPQRPTCPADRAILCRPPHHKVENGGQVAIDGIAFPLGLAQTRVRGAKANFGECLTGLRADDGAELAAAEKFLLG